MAERSGAVAPSVPAQAAAISSSRHRCGCCGDRGCGLGLARLVGRLRRRQGGGRRARRRGCPQCQQYDPLSYARNFDLGDDDAALVHYGYSFSSRFVMAPPSTAAAAADPSRPVVTSH